MKYEYFIVDGMNLFFKSYHTKKGNYTHPYAGLINFISFLKWLENNLAYSNYKIHIVWDAKGESTENKSKRKMIDPDYKRNRSNTKFTGEMENVYHRLKEILVFYSDKVTMYENCEFEGDDFVPEIIKDLKKESNILLVSEDEDWARSISENIHWFAKGHIYTSEKYFQKFGYYPTKNRIILYKSLKGDTSDNIKKPLNGRISKQDLSTILTEINNLNDLKENINSLDIKENLKDDIRSNFYRIKLNWQLIDFLPFDDYDMEISKIPCKKNNILRKEMYIKLGIDYSSLEPELKEIQKKLSGNSPDLFGEDIIRI